MEKQVIRKNANYYFSWEQPTEISQLEKDLQALKDKGATHVEINVIGGYDGDYSLDFTGYTERIETDSEQAERLRIEQERAEQQRGRDLKQYEIIKSKYNL